MDEIKFLEVSPVFPCLECMHKSIIMVMLFHTDILWIFTGF